MTAQKLRTIGIRNALLFIFIGVILYVAYYFTSANLLIYLEYIFIFIAGAVNFIILLRILNYVKKHKRNRVSLLVTAGIILISLLSSIILFRYMTRLQDTMRIKFVNSTGFELTDIKITGCQKKYIDNITAGGSQTVWITISRICPINISYKQNGSERTETVSAYVEPSNGTKLTYLLK